MKGKLALGIVIGVATTLFVQNNKWCQEKIGALKEKGNEFLEKCQQQKAEEEPKEENEQPKDAPAEKKE